MRQRREFPTKVKVAAFQRAAGRCENCTAHLIAGKFEYDHRLADGLGGEPTLDNCVVLCRACHSAKTATHDVPMIAKSKRVHAKHIGARQPSRHVIAGSKRSLFKKKLDGSVVRR